MNNIVLRGLTGIVFVTVVIGALLWSVHATTAVFSVFLLLGSYEFFKLFKNHSSRDVSIVIGMGITVILTALTICSIYDLIRSDIFALALIPLFMAGSAAEIWRNKREPILNSAIVILGIVYVVLPFLLIISMHSHLEAARDGKGIPLILGMFLLIWTNDSFAYGTGRLFGKTKLIERISPNKTWEGTIGGIFFALVVGAILGYFTGDYLLWISSAAIVAPGAIIGDLFESVIKRRLKIKDSGKILPGHGGILDRFDATLFAAPFFFLWITIYMQYF